MIRPANGSVNSMRDRSTPLEAGDEALALRGCIEAQGVNHLVLP